MNTQLTHDAPATLLIRAQPRSEALPKVLNLLTETQLQKVTDFIVFEINEVAERNPLGDWAKFEPWFDELSPYAQELVVELFNTKFVEDHGLILTKYNVSGQQSAFRFEIASIPVAS